MKPAAQGFPCTPAPRGALGVPWRIPCPGRYLVGVPRAGALSSCPVLEPRLLQGEPPSVLRPRCRARMAWP